MVATRRSLAAMSIVLAIIAAAATIALIAFREEGFTYQDPFDPLPSPAAQGTGTEVEDAPDPVRNLDAFLEFAFTDIQAFWEGTLESNDIKYVPATLTVFRAAVNTACGPATGAVGPFYCALERRVYLDAGFFRQLAVEFQAPGDFAAAYVIAHEMGHHVQNLTGITSAVMRASAEDPANANELSIGLELQADCLAGVWGHSTYEREMIDRGDLEEALRAAAAVGDDRIQQRTTGRIDPESWTHGSSEQRQSWWLRGYEAGDPDACNTFSGV
jgi:predicted metalloprotease